MEEDNHKTTFITEWGRYRYAMVPQGYGSFTDGYTMRTDVDVMLASVPDRPDRQDSEKIVEAMLGCYFLLRSFSFPKKRWNMLDSFWEWMVSIKPTDEYIEVIKNFQSPRS